MEKQANLHHNSEGRSAVRSNSTQIGFILPALVVFSLVLASMGVIALQYVTASTSAVSSTNFSAVAKSAADAGLEHALSCLEGANESWGTGGGTNLTPALDCNASAVSGASSTLSASGSWKSTYEVSKTTSTDKIIVTSEGRVEFYYAGASTPSKTFTSYSKASVPISAGGDVRAVAQGNAVTKISAGNGITCAIANMQLWCSGQRSDGRMANGLNQPTLYYDTPVRINSGNLANKYITDIQVNSFNHCAIASGQSYCWGRNTHGSIGNGSTQNYISPTTPNNVAGFSYTNTRIASPGKSWANDLPYTCFLNQLRVFCTGSNITAQLGRPYIGCFGIIFCTWKIRDDPHHTLRGQTTHNSLLPLRVYGYDVGNETEARYNTAAYYTQSMLYQTRPTGLDSGAYQICTLVNSRVFCWGDRFITEGFDINTAPDDIGNIKATSGWRDPSGAGTATSSFGVGESTSCLVSNGELSCWGYAPGNGTTAQNANGLNGPTMPHVRWNVSKATNLTGVNIEGFHAHSDIYLCAYGDGDAYCWGTGSAVPNELTPSQIIAGNSPTDDRPNVTDVAAGFDQICVVANGSQYCRGQNNTGSNPSRQGMLGTGDLNSYTSGNYTKKSESSIGLTEGDAATKISSGANHSCAIANNYVYCWGRNDKGQLGDDTTLDRNQPTGIKRNDAIFNARGATQVATGANHSCAIISGKVYCWGDNTYGQLGNNSSGSGNSSTIPVAVTMPSGYKATSIDAGDNHTCMVANGRAYCWGLNDRGQLGDNTTTNRSSPRAVTNLSTGNPTNSDIPTTITTGSKFSCAIANARAYCWGDNTQGQVGRNSSTATVLTPYKVPAGTGINADEDEWISIDAGDNFACATINQVVRCWGNNSYGQLGRGNTTNASGGNFTPVTVTGPSGQNVGWMKSTAITAGGRHACAIANGEAYCWGDNTNGKLGDNSSTQRTDTRRVTRSAGYLSENNIYALAAGGNHTCGIANGRITCWGNGTYGQLANTTNTASQLTPTWQGVFNREGRSLDVAGATVY